MDELGKFFHDWLRGCNSDRHDEEKIALSFTSSLRRPPPSGAADASSATRGVEPRVSCHAMQGSRASPARLADEGVRRSAIISSVKTRDDALQLLHEYTKTDSLRKHALAVEHAMKACARKYAPDEDPVRWGMAGLLHDFDYEQFPNADQHPFVGSKILEEHGFDDDFRTAILGHAPYTGVPRTTSMARALFACDELCGFLTACALVQPGKSLAEVKVSSVKKKLKDKAFARTVSRDDIYNGVAELGVDLEEHIAFVREALLEIADQIGV